mgnify:FL=1
MSAKFKPLLLLFLSVFFIPAFTYAQSPPALERYVVVLKDNSVPAEVASEVARKANGQVGYVYEHAIKGFSLAVAQQALAGILRNPKVSYVEKDIAMTAFAQTIPTGVERIFSDTTALDIDGMDDFRVDVDVAVLDTGIDMQHPDLNVVGGANCMNTSGGGPPWARSYFCDESQGGDDDHYHGTHVAGTIAALDNGIGVVGIAQGARLWALKVLDSQGSGSLSGIIAAVDWVVAQGNIEVINMSLGGSGTSTAMDDAIEAAFNNGVTVVVAAGNEAADSAGYTPANSPYAITVSALADFDGLPGALASATCRADQDDTLADFSNWGSIVDIAAPGVCILSTYPLEQGEYNTISGTSMASPHVAGAAALLASKGNSVQTIWNTLVGTGNFNWTDDSPDGILEPLLDISSSVFIPALIAADDPGQNNPPTAEFSYSCTMLSCDFDASASSDSDGSIVSYAWDFGDGASSNEMNPSYSYASANTYTVVLTVTDDDIDTGTAQQDVTVTEDDSPVLLTESINNGSTWTARVYYATNDILLGTWSSGSGSCSGNECSQSGIAKKQSSVDFTSDKGVTVTIFKP